MSFIRTIEVNCDCDFLRINLQKNSRSNRMTCL
jgi:hypothetical protein